MDIDLIGYPFGCYEANKEGCHGELLHLLTEKVPHLVLLHINNLKPFAIQGTRLDDQTVFYTVSAFTRELQALQ